ncbi:MAG: TetR family transcriptional regulator C-terminal domain-containing protein, partial [Curtobacterium sp.]
RIAIALWQRAMTERAIGAHDDDVVARWTAQLSRHLAEAMANDEVSHVDADIYASLLMHAMIGLQVSAGLRDDPTPVEQRRLLDAVLDPIRLRGA